jgi:hypothetical protein
MSTGPLMLTFGVRVFSSPELDIGVTRTMARTTQPATGGSLTNVVHERPAGSTAIQMQLQLITVSDPKTA